MISKEELQKGEKADISIGWEDKIFRAELTRISFEHEMDDGSIVEVKENDRLIALYLYDETKLNEYMKANQEQKLVAALVYIDNYDEALESIEDVKR